MVNNKKNRLGWFWPKLSHTKRDGVTHTRVMLFKMAWLILSTERYGEIDRIELTWHLISTCKWVVLVHMTWLIHESRQSDCCDLKGTELRNKFRMCLFLDFFKKGQKKSECEMMQFELFLLFLKDPAELFSIPNSIGPNIQNLSKDHSYESNCTC
jgi:hypothetical protein